MRPSRTTLAICVLMGLSLAMAACTAITNTAAKPHAVPRARSVSTTTTPGSSHPTTTLPSSVTTPPSSPTRPAPPPTPPPPGVVADCTHALPYRLSVRPAGITIACADDGLGVENMAWTSWTASAATGRGMFWEKLCKPDCADGKIGTYPVAVKLSALKTSSQGPGFSRLTVTWEGIRQPSATPDSFLLTPPIS